MSSPPPASQRALEPPGAHPSAARSGWSKAVEAARHLSSGRLLGVTSGLVVICVYFWAASPVFMTWANWENIIRSEAVVAIIAIGMTFVVLTGGIDLSVGSLTAAAAVVLGLTIDAGWPLAVLACLGAAVGMGLLNGLLTGPARIPFFVVTLATLSIYQSIALVTAPGGQTISLESVEAFQPIADLANGSIGPIPSVLVLIACLYALGACVLRFTSFGHAVYAVGSNREAARLAGIRVTAVLVAVYTVSGLTAGIGAVVLAGRLTAAETQADPNLMLTIVAAVLIGGAAFSGGEGNLLGTAVGVLFLGVIDNGLTLQNVNAFWQGTISGLILIGSVGIGVMRRRSWKLGRPQPRQWPAALAAVVAARRTPVAPWAASPASETPAARGRRPRRSPGAVLGGTSLGRVTGPAAGLVAICVYLWITEPVFMTLPNWQNILRTQAAVGIIAVGMTFVVLTAGIDLSVASIAAASGITLGLLVGAGWAWEPAALVAVGLGAVMGFLNGFTIGFLKIPFFVVTLGTLSIYASIALLLSGTGETKSLLGFSTFGTVSNLANGTIWKLPTIFVITAGLYLVASLVLRYTGFGRAVYAVGSNSDAASLTGISVKAVQIAVYTLSGALAALGSIVLAGRITATAPQADPNLMLTVVAAVLIGGVAFAGGEGNLLGTATGVLFLGVVQDGLTLRNVNSFWQGMVSGIVLLAAVGIGVLRQHRSRISRVARRGLRAVSHPEHADLA